MAAVTHCAWCVVMNIDMVLLCLLILGGFKHSAIFVIERRSFQLFHVCLKSVSSMLNLLPICLILSPLNLKRVKMLISSSWVVNLRCEQCLIFVNHLLIWWMECVLLFHEWVDLLSVNIPPIWVKLIYFQWDAFHYIFFNTFYVTVIIIIFVIIQRFSAPKGELVLRYFEITVVLGINS
jgi:hypothetical protein